MSDENRSSVDATALREQVKEKYREVATDPEQEFHFHTGRELARRLGYESTMLDQFPDSAVESFAGVGNPFSLRSLQSGESVVDIGSGAGFDCFVAATQVGNTGQVIGVDMTEEMLSKSRLCRDEINLGNIEFREGIVEELPVDDEWADAVISNGVINLCPDKQQTMKEIFRVLKPGGHLQFADIANGKPVPQAAVDDIDLWTA